MSQPATVAIQVFLETLFRPDDGLIECRALPGKDRVFVKPGQAGRIQRFAEQHKAENIFFGVASRADTSSGRLENCTVVRALYSDIDFKTSEVRDPNIPLYSRQLHAYADALEPAGPTS